MADYTRDAPKELTLPPRLPLVGVPNQRQTSVETDSRLINGYVEMGKRDVHLTERGLEVARQMWERHCFFVGLLEDAGVAPEVASQEGCHMEHCLSEESFEKLRSMLRRDGASAPTMTD